MNVWIIIAAVLMIIGIVRSVAESQIKKAMCVNPLLNAITAMIVEAGIFGITQISLLTFQWDTSMIVKISFIIIPICALICLISLIVSNNYYHDVCLTVCGISLIILIASAFTCAIFWLIPKWWMATIAEIVILSILIYATPIKTGQKMIPN